MPRYTTNSWQARSALAHREAYKTGGAMQAIDGAYYTTGRLNEDWTERYRNDRERIVYTVLSYYTPIAWVLDDGTVVNVDQKFSITTSGHQSIARNGLGASVVEASDRASEERQRERDRRAGNVGIVPEYMGGSVSTRAQRIRADISAHSADGRPFAPVRLEYSETYSLVKGYAAPRGWGGDEPSNG